MKHALTFCNSRVKKLDTAITCLRLPTSNAGETALEAANPVSSGCFPKASFNVALTSKRRIEADTNPAIHAIHL